jgi:hypothetical protein
LWKSLEDNLEHRAFGPNSGIEKIGFTPFIEIGTRLIQPLLKPIQIQTIFDLLPQGRVSEDEIYGLFIEFILIRGGFP